MIKQQIEILILDEYMKRDEKDKANLIYQPWAKTELIKNLKKSLKK